MSESDKNVLNNLVRRLGKALEDTCNRLVFIDGKPYVHPGDTATAESILTLVGLCPTSYRVHIENPCEPEEPCELTCERVIKNGFRFQPIARDGNLGRDDPGPGIPPPLARQVRDLEAEGLAVEHVDGGKHFVVTIAPVPLPAGLGGQSSQVMILVPKTFPTAAIDMFYLPTSVTGASEAFKKRANRIETHGGKQWRRVSWHRTTPWRPGAETLSSYLAFVREGLKRIA